MKVIIIVNTIYAKILQLQFQLWFQGDEMFS